MTKIQQILNALVNGETLTTMGVARKMHTVKLPSRVSDIEKKYNIKLLRKWAYLHDKRGNIVVQYYEYTMKIADRKKIKSMLKK